MSTYSKKTDPLLCIKNGEYISQYGWRPLPRWVSFYVDLGALHQYPTGGFRRVTVLSLPTRLMAATLIAAGYVVAKASSETKRNELDLQLIEAVRRWDIGATIYLRQDDRRLKAIFQGIEHIGGEERIRISYQQGGEKYLALSEVSKLQLTGREVGKLPKHQKGRSLSPAGPFLETVFGPESSELFVEVTRHECVLIGQREQLLREAQDCKLKVFDGRWEYFDEPLSILLRMRDHQSEVPYRTLLISSRSQVDPHSLPDPAPALAIFDGSQGFLRQRDLWRDSDWIVLLDRTETRCAEAVEEVRSLYYERILEPSPLIAGTIVPTGIQLTTFLVPK